MTLTLPSRIGCAACGAPRHIHRILSTHTWGSPDLDFRPPPEQRGLLELCMQACEFCGYCATDLARPPTPAQRAHMQQPGYRQRLADPLVPITANRFRAAAELRQIDGDTLASAQLLLAAAWVCDDEAEAPARTLRDPPPGEPAGSGDDTSFFTEGGAAEPSASPDHPSRHAAALRLCAAAAFEQFLGARLQRATPPDDAWSVPALQWVDALRRAGAFAAAAETAENLRRLPNRDLSPDFAARWEDTLLAQVQLARAGDAGRRTQAQAAAMRPRREEVQADRARAAAQRREDEARAAQRRQEAASLITPAHWLARIAALQQESTRWDLATLRASPMPSGVSEDLARLAVDEGWPADALLAGIALALLAAVPGLARPHAAAVPAWHARVAGHERMARHLEHVFRRCTPKAWHYWPPAGPRVFEG